MRTLVPAVLLLALAPLPASALISTVNFHGYGRVTSVDVTDPNLQPPVVGGAVLVTGTLNLGPAAVPDDYTGTVAFDQDSLHHRQQRFDWSVAGGRAGGTSTAFAYAGGLASFVAGRLTSVDIYNDYDSEIEDLTPTRWSATFPYAESSWVGSWVLAVPEPSSWVLMIAGFGLVGLGLRRNRSSCQAA